MFGRGERVSGGVDGGEGRGSREGGGGAYLRRGIPTEFERRDISDRI